MKLFLAYYSVLTAASMHCVLGDHWALLVSGGIGFLDYHFEADVCHAYHVLRNKGIPEDRIIVMMWDDVAYSDANPFPGTLVNFPNGTNVYKGVKIDYRLAEVSSEIFLKVLAGDEKGIQKSLGRRGKVIRSGPKDNIFVYMANSGAPYLIQFGLSSLHAAHLNTVLLNMHKQKQYNEMVIYMDANEAGSVFDLILHDNINVFVVTSCNPHQGIPLCFWDPTRGTFVGDLFSVTWMEELERSDVAKESLNEQYGRLKAKIKRIDVMKYGDMSVGLRKVGYFQGNVSRTKIYENTSDSYLHFRPESKLVDQSGDPCVSAEDIQIEILKRKLVAASKEDRPKHESAIRDLVEKKNGVRIYFKSIVESFENLDYDEIQQMPLHSRDLTCYQQGIAMIMQSCPGLNLLQNRYALRSLRALANLCEADAAKEMIWAAIKRVSYTSDMC